MTDDTERKVLELLDRMADGWTEEEIDLFQSATHIPSVRRKLWEAAVSAGTFPTLRIEPR